MNYTRVIAFDQSPTKTGWAESARPGEAFTALEYGLCPSFRKATSGERAEDHEVARLLHVLRFIKARVLRPGERPLVFMEGFAFSMVQHAHMMGGLGYTARLFFAQNGIDYIVVSPGSLKKFASGTGNAKKELMVKAALQRFNVDTDDNNVADAVALCHVGMAFLDWWEPTTAQQREVVELLRKNNPRLAVAA